MKHISFDTVIELGLVIIVVMTLSIGFKSIKRVNDGRIGVVVKQLVK